MSSAAIMTTQARQPLGAVSQSRLRNLTNIKNAQNALVGQPSASILKRHSPKEFDDLDAENVDPSHFSSPLKKSKFFDEQSVTYSKPVSRFTLTPVSRASKTVPRQSEIVNIASSKPKAGNSNMTPDALPLHHNSASAPAAPAGRSPRQKRVGILSRRRAGGPAYTRINPPRTESSVPCSLNAALAATISMKSKSKSSTKGHHFTIYEDSPEEEMANLMEHSTCTLEISDDEGRSSPRGECDNKENVPPPDCRSTGNVASLNRRDAMTEDIRQPLGDLNASDFYAEGCDKDSVIVISADEGCHEQSKLTDDFTPPSPSKPAASLDARVQAGWESLVSELAAKQDAEPDVIPGKDDLPDMSVAAGEVQIWESESAKAEEETSPAAPSSEHEHI